MLIWISEQNAVRAADDRVISAARISAANVRQTVTATLDKLAGIDEALGSDPAKFNLSGIPGADGFIGLYSATGDTIGRDGQRGASVSSNAEFQALAQGKPWSITPLIGAADSPIRLFGIAHRIDREGEFGGVITAFFPADYLSDTWSIVDLGPDSTVGLFRDDGEMVTRYPVPDTSINLKDYELFTQHLPRASSGAYRATSPVDGHDRTVGYEALKDLGLIAIVSMSQSSTSGAF